MTWCELRMQQLEEKGRENWNEDDVEAYNYIMCVWAMDKADEEYLSNYTIIE